jgi:hypothetical protein
MYIPTHSLSLSSLALCRHFIVSVTSDVKRFDVTSYDDEGTVLYVTHALTSSMVGKS